MNKTSIQRALALSLAAALAMTGGAGALFGRKQADPPASEGAPVARELTISTYRSIPYQAQFLATDAEGEDLTFAVVEQPRKGTVTVDGATFTYTPDEGITGGDRFTYAATDSAGNVSQPAAVHVRIEKIRSGVTYADTRDSAAAAAAQHLAEAGIFTGAQIGEQYYFEPDKPVTRSEFLAMVMETGERKVSAVTMTGFCDDAAIPAWAKAYAAAGVADGIVRGSATDRGAAFRGAAPITFREAAAMLDRTLGLADVDLSAQFPDRQADGSWAGQAVGNLEHARVLAAGSFGSSAMTAPVTRADAARMLSAARGLLEADPAR